MNREVCCLTLSPFPLCSRCFCCNEGHVWKPGCQEWKLGPKLPGIGPQPLAEHLGQVTCTYSQFPPPWNGVLTVPMSKDCVSAKWWSTVSGVTLEDTALSLILSVFFKDFFGPCLALSSFSWDVFGCPAWGGVAFTSAHIVSPCPSPFPALKGTISLPQFVYVAVPTATWSAAPFQRQNHKCSITIVDWIIYTC